MSADCNCLSEQSARNDTDDDIQVYIRFTCIHWVFYNWILFMDPKSWFFHNEPVHKKAYMGEENDIISIIGQARSSFDFAVSDPFNVNTHIH